MPLEAGWVSEACGKNTRGETGAVWVTMMLRSPENIASWLCYATFLCLSLRCLAVLACVAMVL